MTRLEATMLVLVAALAGCMGAPRAPATFSAPPPPTALNVVFGDGTHSVPDRVKPGTYRTISYTDNCYWVRLSGFNSGLADWIASGIGPGFHVVTIGAGDAGFDSTDCGEWTDEIVQVTSSMMLIGEGTYVVGKDMQRGTWRADGGSSCYWARLSGFGGTEQELVEEDLTADGVAPLITIAETDVGFTSNGCGSWRSEAP